MMYNIRSINSSLYYCKIVLILILQSVRYVFLFFIFITLKLNNFIDRRMQACPLIYLLIKISFFNLL